MQWGAVVAVLSGGKRQVHDLVAGASYCSASDPRLLFGLDTMEKVDMVEIRWPSGVITSFENLSSRKYYRLEEPVTPRKDKP